MEILLGGGIGPSSSLGTFAGEFPHRPPFRRLAYLPSIPVESVYSHIELDALADVFSETLTNDVISVGSIMGTKIGRDNAAYGAALITSLLAAGFAYVVGTGGKLMALLNMERSVLCLRPEPFDPAVTVTDLSPEGSTAPSLGPLVLSPEWAKEGGAAEAPTTSLGAASGEGSGKGVKSTQAAKVGKGKGKGSKCAHDAKGAGEGDRGETSKSKSCLPPSLAKRRRDIPRVLRNKMPSADARLQLRLNWDFEQALRKLRSHHGDDCWVDEELEAVWRVMVATSPPQLLVFELWLDDVLIAADFGHPTANGTSVYVATRFFESEHKALQPGFILALAECKVLRDCGFLLWDLGGFDR